MFKKIENNDAGIRSQSGTKLINGLTREVVYTPPESIDEIINFLKILRRILMWTMILLIILLN